MEQIVGEGLLRAFAGWADRPLWLAFWTAVSFLGSPLFFTTAVPLLFALAPRAHAHRFAVAFLTSTLISEALKWWIGRPRLDWAALGLAAPLEHGGEFDSASLPSGHVLTATVVWGMLALRARSPWARAGAWAVVPLMAISRMALLRHDLLDVGAGFAVGGLLLWGLRALQRGVAPRLSPLPWVEQAGLWTLGAIAFVALAPLHSVSVAAGVLAGLAAGAAWARERGLPELARWSPRALGAAVLALGGAAAARAVGHSVWPGDSPGALIGSFALYGLAGLWIARVVPGMLARRRAA